MRVQQNHTFQADVSWKKKGETDINTSRSDNSNKKMQWGIKIGPFLSSEYFVLMSELSSSSEQVRLLYDAMQAGTALSLAVPISAM